MGVPRGELTFAFDVMGVADDSGLRHGRVGSLCRTERANHAGVQTPGSACRLPQLEEAGSREGCLSHHRILDLRSPQPVAADVDDIVHTPRDLVIAALGPESAVSSEVVACMAVGGSAPVPLPQDPGDSCPCTRGTPGQRSDLSTEGSCEAPRVPAPYLPSQQPHQEAPSRCHRAVRY